MVDPSRTGQEPGATPEDGSPPGMPGWVKAAGVAVGVLILLAVVLMVAGGEHSPARHAPGAGAVHPQDATPIEGAPELAVTAADLRFDPDRIELPAGLPVNVALTSADVMHDLVVDELGFHLGAERGETAVGGLVFPEPGTYLAYCSVPGHREAGMQLEFVVGDHEDLEEFFRDLHG